VASPINGAADSRAMAGDTLDGMPSSLFKIAWSPEATRCDEGHDVVLLLSQKGTDAGYVIAQLQLDAPTNEQAWVKAASGLLPPIIGTVLARFGLKIMVSRWNQVRKYFRINSASPVGA
jgi:hypothetical protein